MRRLFLDIETSPNVVFSWRIGWKISIDSQNIIKERAIICVCYKWENEKTVKFLKWDKNQSDKKLIQMIVPVLNSADEIVGQNLDNFDLPWIRTRAIFHGVPISPYYKSVDTLQYAKRKLYFNSNKLDYMGKFLGLGGKIKTEFGLWKDVLNNDKSALDTMVKYCKRDVVLLEKVYHKLADSMPVHTHSGVLDGNAKWTCARCSSSDVHLELTRYTATGIQRRQMGCKKCGRFYTVSDATYRAYLRAKKDEADNKRKLREANKVHEKVS
jgi:hypothetical protein